MANKVEYIQTGINVAGLLTSNTTVVLIGANVAINTTAFAVGANVYANTTAAFLGNTTVNTVITSSTMTVSNSTSNTIQGVGGITYPDGNLQARAAYGVETIWIPAGAMYPRTTNPAIANTFESTTNKVNLQVLDFEATANTYAQFNIKMPKSWNASTVVARFSWLQVGTTSNFTVYWSLAGVAFSSADALDTAMGTLQSATSNGAVNNAIYTTGNTSAITIGNTPAAEDLCVFEVKRTPGDASDTLAVAAKLVGVTLFVTTNQTNDA